MKYIHRFFSFVATRLVMFSVIAALLILAFYLARMNEIKTARIILTGKANGFSEEAIRERVREMYV